MRRYWLPALRADDLPAPGGDPHPVELLGEHFIAFRLANGQVGFMDENCCHRGASLLLGRVEEQGIRCIYHGWKFAPDGAVLETPNVPDQNFRTRVRARAYPTHVSGGLLWVYLGAASERPAAPAWPWLSLPSAHRLVTVHRIRCNFVQVLEGLVDSSHLGILHFNGLKATAGSDLGFASQINRMQFDLAPRIEAEDTEFGFHYAALRATADGAHARITAFIAPVTVLNPNGDVATIVVPENETSCRFYHVFWDLKRTIGQDPLRSEHERFVGLDHETMRAYGITLDTGEAPSRANRFHQERSPMEVGTSFSGLPGLIEEDVAVSVSAGALRDRSRELLSISDIAIGRLYRVLLRSARQAAQGQDPVGVRADTRHVRGTQGDLPPAGDWRGLVPLHNARAAQQPDAPLADTSEPIAHE